MFCYKCGAQMEEGAAFCQKCGAKIVNGDAAGEIAGQSQQIVEQSIPGTESVSSVPAFSSGMAADEDMFRQFVDNHIRKTTKFQSADDLINNSKPMTFVWICFGVLSLLGLIMGGPVGLLVIGAFFGYAVTFIAGAIIRHRYRDKFYGEFEQEIDIEDFRMFLDGHLKTLSPYFHECGYMDRKGGLQTMIGNAASRVAKETTLACVCGSKKKRLATICIRPHIRERDSGKKQYIVGAEYQGFLFDSRLSGFLAHACLIRTAPIMQAAIEFYLNQNKQAGEVRR